MKEERNANTSSYIDSTQPDLHPPSSFNCIEDPTITMLST